MRVRAFTVVAAAAALVLTACGGGDGDATPPGAPNAIPTATPFAVVPSPTVVSGPGASGAAVDEVTYVVEAGDAISTIAARFGVPEDLIRQVNGVEGNDIFIGQVLRIPRTTGMAPATPTPSAPSGGPGTYVVQPGDTAFGIALQFDVTVEALERANGVGPGGLDALSLGQVLRIPSP